MGDGPVASIGSHCILELYDCPPGLLDDPIYIRDALREAAREAESTLLGELHHVFEPQGVTALVLLAESHISIHTWPELGYAAVDVFTCGAHTKPEKACDFLVRKLQARRHQLRKLPRGGKAPEVRPDRCPAPAVGSGETPGEAPEEACLCRVRSFARITG